MKLKRGIYEEFEWLNLILLKNIGNLLSLLNLIYSQ